MKKNIIRPTYPKEFSIGFVLLLFFVSFFLSPQIFDVSYDESETIYGGMFLASLAVIIMLLILWEEILFPLQIKAVDGGLIFRNHRTKLRVQLLIYCLIPAIFIFLYLEYEVKLVRFCIWAGMCLVLPVIEKIASGVKNYNDFLSLSDKQIEYKNNEKEGSFPLADLQSLTVLRDDAEVIDKIQLLLKNNSTVTIDLDEMELDAFYDSIDKYITDHYAHLLK